MKIIKLIQVVRMNRIGLAVALMAFSACSPVVYEQVSAPPPPPPTVVYVAPAWAPPYGNVQNVQYYFLPDIDAYYDAATAQFVYNDGYTWVYASTLPPMYAQYDLNSAYVVYLTYGCQTPWVNNQVYVEHYPRQYYNTYYTSNQQYYNSQPLRGYNENARQPIYAPRGSWNNANTNTGNSGVGGARQQYNTGNSGVNTQPNNGYNNNGQQHYNTGNSGVNTQPNGGYNNQQYNSGNSGVNTQQPSNNNNTTYTQPAQQNNTGNSGVGAPRQQYNTGNSGIGTTPPTNNNQNARQPQGGQNTQLMRQPQQNQGVAKPLSKNVGQPVAAPNKGQKKVINNKPQKKTSNPNPNNNNNK